MPTRDIVCSSCGLRGKIEWRGLEEDAPVSAIFRHLGHDPFSGYMHYRCPACKKLIHANPMDVLGSGVITGLADNVDKTTDREVIFPLLKKIFSLLAHF